MIKYIIKLISKLSLCAKVGLLVGIITGMAVTLLDLFKGGIILNTKDAAQIALAMAIFNWLLLLFFLGIIFRYAFKSFTFPVLLNCLLTSFATVFLAKSFNSYPLAWLIGMLIGIIIGSLLCRLNALLNLKTK